MIKSNFYIAVLVILLFACQTNDSKEEVKDEYSHDLFACPNEEWLFAVEDSLPVLELDFSLPYDSLYGLVENKLRNSNENEFAGYISFNTIIDDNFEVKICTRIPYKNSRICYPTHTQNILEILVNNNNQILFEAGYTTTDSLSNKIEDSYFIDLYSSSYRLVYFKWGDKTSSDIISIIIREVLLGILNQYRKLAQSEYQKDICELRKAELDQLKSKLRWELLLFPEKEYPPPPPPKIE